LARSDPDAWSQAADINFKGVYNGMRAVLPLMRARSSGVIINMGSGAAHNPMEGWSHYCASKAAALMLTRCAHLENKGHGIRLFSLSPGTVQTDMQRKIKASGINAVSQIEFSQHAPVGVPAKALVWLCGDAAAEFSGQEISLRDQATRARIGFD
jgi:NAD(P)-dependent dehydrogenase (short-subunit alcohol dehydrogenase family)